MNEAVSNFSSKLATQYIFPSVFPLYSEHQGLDILLILRAVKLRMYTILSL